MREELLARKVLLAAPTEKGPKFVSKPGGVLTSPALLGPVFLWSQQDYLR